MSSTIITQQMDSKGGKELLRACSTTDLNLGEIGTTQWLNDAVSECAVDRQKDSRK